MEDAETFLKKRFNDGQGHDWNLGRGIKCEFQPHFIRAGRRFGSPL